MNGKGKAGVGAFLVFFTLWIGAKYTSWLTEEAVVRITCHGSQAVVEVRLSEDSPFEVHEVGSEPVVLSVPARAATVALQVREGKVRVAMELRDARGPRPRRVTLDLAAGQRGTLHSETGVFSSRSRLGTGLATGNPVRPAPGRANRPDSGDLAGLAVRRVVVTAATLDALELAVPADFASVEPGKCSSGPSLPHSSRGLRVTMVWGPEDKPSRRVSVTLDAGGGATRFNDVRGALMNIKTRGHPEPGTSVFLDLKEQLAIIENQHPTGEIDARKVPFSDALQSRLLGNPARLMDFVLTHCAGDGKPEED